MTLEEYRQQKSLTYEGLAAFLRLSGANAPRAVRRYALHERMPRVAVLRRIMEVTEGAVTANDFLLPPPRQAQRRPRRAREVGQVA